jgi:hypothetical protein
LRARTGLFVSVLGVIFLSRAVASGEVLFAEGFDTFDLAKPPAQWKVTQPAELAIIDEAPHGKVLKITAKGNTWPSVGVTLDPAKVRGHNIRIACAAKFPNTYIPLADKTWAHPKMMVTYKDKAGKDQYPGEVALQAGRPEWQDLVKIAAIPQDADAIVVFLRVDLVAAEVFFDDFSVEIDPDPNAPAAKPPGAAPSANPLLNPNAAQNPGANPAQPAAAPKPAPAATGPEAIAAKAPKKALDDGSAVIFGPEVALALQRSVKTGVATKNTYAFVGATLPKELETAKTPPNWNKVASAKEVTGPTATAHNLLTTLPEFIAATKVEAVFIFPDPLPLTRKLTMSEHYEWEDVARACARSGAVPVLVIPASANPDPKVTNDIKDELRNAILQGAAEVVVPVMDLKVPLQLPRRVGVLTEMFDKYVFCRVSADATQSTKPKEPGEE